MIRFALKNLAIKKVQTILVILSIVISAGVVVLAYNVSGQVSDGISGTAGMILGIVALCRLTPEEKRERLWSSGTTKNLAATGIAMPLLIAAGVLWVVIMIAILK